MLRFVGNADQKKFTKNPRHFSMQNSQANTKKNHKSFLEGRQSHSFLSHPEIWAVGISAQGILHLRDPNLGPNSAKQNWTPEFVDPNSWVEFFHPLFSSKRAPPPRNSPSRNSLPKIPKTQTRNRAKKSHCTSPGPFG